MLPGPDLVKACTACGAAAKQATLLSGNTLGASYWTDGYMRARMLPSLPLVGACPNCGLLLWLDDLPTIARIATWRPLGYEPSQHELRMEKEYGEAKGFRYPALDDYFRYLESSLADPKRSREVRIRAWWEGNHRRRGTEGPVMSARERENLTVLAGLLDGTTDRGRLLKAEALRELGRFIDALRTLLEPVEPDLEGWAKLVGKLSERRLDRVAQLPAPENASIAINSKWLAS